MGRWGDYKNQTPKSGGDGKYVKLADGDSIRFALTDTEPVQRVQYWLEGKVVSAGTRGAQMDTKIMLCVYDVDLGKMRILSLTPNTFVRLCEKCEKFREDDSPNTYELERQKKNGKVIYELDRLDRLTAAQIQARDREPVYDVFEEQGVEALPEAAAPVQQKRGGSSTSAMPPEAPPDAPDESVPF